MRKVSFKITLLSRVILPKGANTQGANESLSFISGAVFLGLVARHYDEFNDACEIFHGSKLRFGDARVLINGKMSYKMPLCFFTPKEKSDLSELYNACFVDLLSQNFQEKQLKQSTQGYINEDLDFVLPKRTYTQKVNLQTKDNELFGYESLEKGTTLGFELSFDESILPQKVEQITQILLGEQFIGKAKSAEFGRVFIERADFGDLKELDSSKSAFVPSDLSFIYCVSSLALFDKNTAMPSFELNAANLGLENALVDLSKTHIKTRIYSPYNAKRQGFDSTRLIIEQGSVIAVRGLCAADKERLKRGVGGFLSEGYGQVLVNPSFLMSGCDEKPFSLKIYDNQSEIQPKIKAFDKDYAKDESLIKSLQELKAEQDTQERDFANVNAFIKAHGARFAKISNAQWGALRNIAYFEPNFAQKVQAYTNKERLKAQWGECARLLNDFVKDNTKNAVQLLAMLMSKQDLSRISDE